MKAIYARPKFSGNMLSKLSQELKDYIIALQDKKIEYDEETFTKLEQQCFDSMLSTNANVEKSKENFQEPNNFKKGNLKSSKHFKNKQKDQIALNTNLNYTKEIETYYYPVKNQSSVDHVRKQNTVSTSNNDYDTKINEKSVKNSNKYELTENIPGKNSKNKNLNYKDQQNYLINQNNNSQFNGISSQDSQYLSNVNNQYYAKNYEYDCYHGGYNYLNQNDNVQREMPKNSNQQFKSGNSNSFPEINDSSQMNYKNSQSCQNFQEANVSYYENLGASQNYEFGANETNFIKPYDGVFQEKCPAILSSQYCSVTGQGYYNPDQETQNYYNSEYNVQQNYMNAPYEFASYQNDQYYANSFDQKQFYNNNQCVNYNVNLVNPGGNSPQKDSHNSFNNDVSYQGYHQYGSEDSNINTNFERGNDQLEGANYNRA